MTSRNTPRNINEFLNQNVETVITVCGNADQVCPVFPGLPGIHPAGRIRLERAPDLVTHSPEHFHFFPLCADRVRGVIERPVMTVHLAGKDGADLVGLDTHGDYCFHRFVEKLGQVL